MQLKTVFRAALVAGAMTAAGTATAQTLAGSEWSPVELAGAPFDPMQDIFVRFEADGRVFGHGGCNSFRSRYVTNGEAILMGPPATTMMACPERVAKQEFMFLQALEKVRHFTREGTTLTLSGADETSVMRLQQRDAD